MSASMPDAALSARERLARSRERMSHWLAAESDDGGEEQTASDSNRPRGARGWLKSLRANPLAAIAVDAFTDWWARHPLQSSARLAEAAARETIAPLVKRHPVAVLGSAALAGALLVWSRPWRWLLKPALLTGRASQIAGRVFAHMASPRSRATGSPKPSRSLHANERVH